VIRISASPRHRHGTEILTYDTRPFGRAELRRRFDEALARLCDEGGYTIEEARCSVVLRIEGWTNAGAEDRPLANTKNRQLAASVATVQQLR
jgi:hypothetical protein